MGAHFAPSAVSGGLFYLLLHLWDHLLCSGVISSAPSPWNGLVRITPFAPLLLTYRMSLLKVGNNVLNCAVEIGIVVRNS